MLYYFNYNMSSLNLIQYYYNGSLIISITSLKKTFISFIIKLFIYYCFYRIYDINTDINKHDAIVFGDACVTYAN